MCFHIKKNPINYDKQKDNCPPILLIFWFDHDCIEHALGGIRLILLDGVCEPKPNKRGNSSLEFERVYVFICQERCINNNIIVI